MKHEPCFGFVLFLLAACSSAEFHYHDAADDIGDAGTAEVGTTIGGHAGESVDGAGGLGGASNLPAAGGMGASQDGEAGTIDATVSIDAGTDRPAADGQPPRDVAQDTKTDAGAATDRPFAEGDGGTDAAFATDLMDDSVSADGSTASPTFRLVRVGDGTTLSSAAAPVFIEERTLDGTLIGSLALPTSTVGATSPLTLSGMATSEGALTLSGDGRYLVLAGYAAPVGTAAVATSSALQFPRVVGRIDASGNVDTIATSKAFDGNNIRSAVSRNGQDFWMSGAGGTTGGIWYLMLGGGPPVHVLATPNNIRWLSWRADARLFASTGVAGTSTVFAVGQGTPTSEGGSAQDLRGLGTKGSAFGFAFLDRNPNIPGFDILYIANDQSAPIGGIQKWTFDGTTWSQRFTLNIAAAPVGFRGLTTFESPSGVLVLGTTAEASSNRVVAFVDDGSESPGGVAIATAQHGTSFRGLSPSPHF